MVIVVAALASPAYADKPRAIRATQQPRREQPRRVRPDGQSWPVGNAGSSNNGSNAGSGTGNSGTSNRAARGKPTEPANRRVREPRVPAVVRHAIRPRRDLGNEGEGIRALLPEPEQAARRRWRGTLFSQCVTAMAKLATHLSERSVDGLLGIEQKARSGRHRLPVQPVCRRGDEAPERLAEAVVQSSHRGGRSFSTRAGPGVDASARLPHGRHARRPDHGPSGAGRPLGHAGRPPRAARDCAARGAGPVRRHPRRPGARRASLCRQAQSSRLPRLRSR